MRRLICTMYWDNIDPSIVLAQKRIFKHLGFEIRQDRATGVQHGEWMDQVLSELRSNDTVIFLDIDCFPLTTEAVGKAFRFAEAGYIYGSAQTANHMPDRELVYAAPSFLSLSSKTWHELGQVSMKRSAEFDVGMALTHVAKQNDKAVHLLFPSFVGCPKWPLGKHGAVGYATFYNSEIFHLFQSRHNKAYEFALHYVADQVLNNAPIDYIYLFKKMNSAVISFEDGLRSLPRNVRRQMSIARRALLSCTSEPVA